MCTISGSNVSNVSRSAGGVGNPGPNTRQQGQQDNLRYVAIQPPVNFDQVKVVVSDQNTASSGCCFTPYLSGSCVKNLLGAPALECGSAIVLTAVHGAANLAATSLGAACLNICIPTMPYGQLAIGVSVGSSILGGGCCAISMLACCGRTEVVTHTLAHIGHISENPMGVCVGLASFSAGGVLGNFVLGNPIGILWLPAVAPMVPFSGSLLCALLSGGIEGGGLLSY